jgi:hypothetical protein
VSKKITKKSFSLKPAADPSIAGVIAVISAIGAFNPYVFFGAAATAVFSAWQNKNFQSFKDKIEKRIKTLENETIDKNFSTSDEFKAIVVQGLQAAVVSASEERHKALANAILSSTTLPTSNFRNKQTILRVIAQMTDEEIYALKSLNNHEKIFSSSEEKATNVVTTEKISEDIQCDMEETRVTCDGLLQLGLAYDAEGQYFDSTGQHRQFWRITALGRRVVQYSTDKT